MSTLIFIFALLPYLYFSFLDNSYHLKLRTVRLPEHLIHFFIFISVSTVIYNAFTLQFVKFYIALGFYVLFGSLDEFLFHKNLPEKESDVHAKAHWSGLIFISVVILTQHWDEIKTAYAFY